MESTTRRISNLELKRMRDLQGLLEAKGIKLNQVQLGELISEYLMENYSEFTTMVLEKLGKKSKFENDSPLHRLLFEPSSEGVESDSVKEHDLLL